MNFFEMSEWVRVQKELGLFESSMLPAPPPPPKRKSRIEDLRPGYIPSQEDIARSDQSSVKTLQYVLKQLKISKPAIFEMAMRAIQGKQGREAYMAARQAVMSANPTLWSDILDMKGVTGPAPPPAPGSSGDIYGKIKHPAMAAPPPPPRRKAI